MNDPKDITRSIRALSTANKLRLAADLLDRGADGVALAIIGEAFVELRGKTMAEEAKR